MFPGERDLLTERAELVATMADLSDDEFESGRTLCSEWSPRDILAHVVGIDRGLVQYVGALGRVSRGNDRIVTAARARTRADLMRDAGQWAVAPSLAARIGAYGLLGDVAVHHQDVLRGLGRSRLVPESSSRAILREGAVLGAKRLLRHRIVPNDVGRPLGRGREVHGTAEQLGMWLAGRDSVTPELKGL